jgi:hypothetical protein
VASGTGDGFGFTRFFYGLDEGAASLGENGGLAAFRRNFSLPRLLHELCGNWRHGDSRARPFAGIKLIL